MKKFLGIVVLGSLLYSCSDSTWVLEKCADENYVEYLGKDIKKLKRMSLKEKIKSVENYVAILCVTIPPRGHMLYVAQRIRNY